MIRVRTGGRCRWMICSGSIVAWLLTAAWPVSSMFTRAGPVLAFCLAVVTFVVNGWRHLWLRSFTLFLIGICGVFAFMPPRAHPSTILKRQEFARALRCYEGVSYLWGGENCIAIDCSGLIRRLLLTPRSTTAAGSASQILSSASRPTDLGRPWFGGGDSEQLFRQPGPLFRHRE